MSSLRVHAVYAGRRRSTVARAATTLSVLALTMTPVVAAKGTQFWNLTAHKITSLQLSPAGKNTWRKNQTDNDPDHSVDNDERLKISETPGGLYDLRFTDDTGRTCVVSNIQVVEGERFSVEEREVKSCTH